MMLDTPTGIPFFYEKMENGSYSKQLATSRKDYSAQALDFINWISFDPKFRKSASQFYTMRSVINGEKKITTPEGVFRVDGYCETPEGQFCLEFYGCRERLKLFLEVVFGWDFFVSRSSSRKIFFHKLT